MAGPFSGWALGAGAVLASPALVAALVDGTLPLPTAVLKLVVAVVISSVGLSLLGALLAQTSGPSSEPEEAPRSLPGVEGPLPVRAAAVDPQPPAENG